MPAAAPRRRGPRLAAACVLAVAWGACAPPTERLTRVRATTPLLAEPEDDAVPAAVLREGELLAAAPSPRPALAWRGRLDEHEATRAGLLVELRRAPDETRGFAFAADLDPLGARAAPTAAWLCAQMQGSPTCAASLRRLDWRGDTLAFEPCPARCTIALAHGRSVQRIPIESLHDARPARLGATDLFIVESRFNDPPRSGARAHVFAGDPSLREVLAIVLDEIDATRATTRLGRLEVEADALVFRGTRREGEATAPIVERYVLPPASRSGSASGSR